MAGDDNEPNDTKETATTLPIGTDAHFSMGGYGDEDWFVFEAAPEAGEAQKLYTLNFLGLNTDYSDTFYYDIYAPDGTCLSEKVGVNINHTDVLACNQQGRYYVRIYTDDATTSRSSLRIRVDEGGADSYEDNDTWLTAAQVQTGQPVQFLLSSAQDADWFCFEVPEPDMTLSINRSSSFAVMLYSGADLQEYGMAEEWPWESALCAFDYNHVSSNTLYYKFTEPGLYYIRANADAIGASMDLRTMTLSLREADEEENNDTWKQATPIYDGVPRQFSLSAVNDEDWFKTELSQPSNGLLIETSGCEYAALYREKDFETAGDNANPIASTMLTHPNILSKNLGAGTYYVRCRLNGSNYTQSNSNATIRYLLLEQIPLGTSLETAVTLEEGVWHTLSLDGYVSLGTLQAGDELRLSSIGDLREIRLVDENGTFVASTSGQGTRSFLIDTTGVYYLYLAPSEMTNADGEITEYQFRYEVGDTEYSPEEISIQGPDTVTLQVGEQYVLPLGLSPHNAKLGVPGYSDLYSMTYENALIAEVNRYGEITANGVGSTVITVSLRYGNTETEKQINVHVVEETKAESLTIQGGGVDTLTVGQRLNLTVAYDPVGANEAVSWSSSDPGVLYVSGKGTVTAVGLGSATITAQTTSSVKATAEFTVTAAPEQVPVESIVLDRYSLTLYVDEEPGQLTAQVRPENAEYGSVTWSSSNPLAATVSQSGEVTAVGPGISVVTASAGGYRASCIVTVQAARVRVESIAFSQEILELPMGGESVLAPTITPADATVQTVTWVSDNEEVATVSRTGIVTALSVGEAKVTVTTLDGGKQASITIRVTAAPQLGDINFDGYVDAGDALLALRYAVGLSQLAEEQLAVADVNRDGYVDAGDAVRILRYNAGLLESL